MEVLVGDVAAHGEDDHEGADHGDRAARGGSYKHTDR